MHSPYATPLSCSGLHSHLVCRLFVCVVVRLVQSQLNDQYDHKRRGDYYYARCQALEEELRRSKVTPPSLSPQPLPQYTGTATLPSCP